MQEALQDTMLKIEDWRRFAVSNTGAYECRSCGHVYDEQKGDSTYPVAAGTLFRDLPEDWLCPTCGAAKTFFKTKSIEVAGFAQNQQYGLETVLGSMGMYCTWIVDWPLDNAFRACQQ